MIDNDEYTVIGEVKDLVGLELEIFEGGSCSASAERIEGAGYEIGYWHEECDELMFSINLPTFEREDCNHFSEPEEIPITRELQLYLTHAQTLRLINSLQEGISKQAERAGRIHATD